MVTEDLISISPGEPGSAFRTGRERPEDPLVEEPEPGCLLAAHEGCLWREEAAAGKQIEASQNKTNNSHTTMELVQRAFCHARVCF